MFGLGGSHNCGDSRLACIDCNGTVCPKCMVQCPVGNRCPKCAGKFTSHLLAVTPWIMLRTLVAAAAVGYAFGHLQSSSMGFYGYFILYGIGILVGNVLHRVAGHKMGPKVIGTVIVGVIVGSAFSPIFSGRLPAAYRQNAPAVISPAAFETLTRSASPSASSAVGDDKLRLELLEVATKQKAQAAWPQFEEAFQAKAGSSFRVRVPVTEGGKTESVWLDVTSVRGPQVAGKVVSEPVLLKQLAPESVVSTERKLVQDWIYNDGSQYVGGFGMLHAASGVAYNPSADQAVPGWFMIGSVINLVLFLAGILTPIAGIVPPIRLPFSRF